MFSRPQRFGAQETSWRHLWLLLIPMVGLLMFRWAGAGLPASPRGESLAQLSYLWLLRRLWASGDALRGWDPLILGGESTVTARIYHLHASLAGLSLLLHITPEVTVKAVQFLANLIGALGSYHLARKLGASRGASLVAGTAYAFFPLRIMLTVDSLFTTVSSASAPWLFWAYERTRLPAPQYKGPAMVWGMLLAISMLSGPQRFLLRLTPLATYILLRELCQPALTNGRRTWSKDLSRLVGVALIAGGVAAGLGMFYYLPTLVGSDQLWTSRYMQSLPRTTRWSVSPSLALSLFVYRWSPGFQAMDWDLVRIFPNLSYYLGGVLCLLAGLGGLARRRWRSTLPLIGVLVVSLMLAAGPQIPHNPAYAIVRRLPMIADSVRNAFRYLEPAALALSVLAALGIERLLSALPGHWTRSSVVVVALALVMFDFWPVTQAFQTTTQYLDQDTITLHQQLDALPGDERYWVPFLHQRPGQHYADTSYGVRYNRRAAINDNEYHTPSAPYRASLFYLQGLDEQIEADEPLDATAEAILDLSNVRYVVLPLEPDLYRQSLSKLAAKDGWRVLEEFPSVALLENLNVLPYAHAYAAGAIIPGISKETVLQTLPLVLAQGHALVETPSRPNAEASALAQVSQTITGDEIAQLPHVAPPEVSLALARPSASEIWVRYQGQAPFLLMISETWYPHWRVSVNGAPQQLLRLNGNFLGVLVQDASQGTVQFRYRRPWYVWLGYAASLLCLIGMVSYWLWPQPVRLRHDA